MKRFFLISLLPLALTICISSVLVSCGNDDPEETIDNHLNLTPETLEFKADGTGLYNYFHLLCNGNWAATCNESWIHLAQTSGNGDTKVTITIDDNTSTEERTAKITVISSNITKYITVIQNAIDKEEGIVEEASKVTSITLSQSSVTLYFGSTLTLSATVLPESADDKTVSWSSDNESIATVTSAGVVSALSVGTANIIATANDGSGITAACTVLVNDPSDLYEYVDLGLPSGTLWATKNVGATNIYDYGDYFAWGETRGYNSGKTNFSESTYKYYADNGSETITTKDDDGFDITTTIYHCGYTKYVRYSDASKYGYDGFYDNKTTLESSDDAATANMGSKWRMPTSSEWNELHNNCTWTWVSLNGVAGYKVTASNGNYIFLPAAGDHNSSDFHDVGTVGSYWSSSLSVYYSRCADYEVFVSYGRNTGRSRYIGQSVRAVRSE